MPDDRTRQARHPSSGPGARARKFPWKKKALSPGILEELARYKTVADFTYDWEIWIDAAGVARYVSPSCRRVSGYPAQEVAHDPLFFHKVLHPDDLPRWLAAMGSSQDAAIPSMDFRIIRRDGIVAWVAQETTRVFGPAGDYRGLRLSLRDVTDRVKAQEALREAHERLEQRVQERTRELDKANRELRREIQRGKRTQRDLERSKEQYRSLSAYQQDRIEQERKRISREIHDELGQNLTALNMGLFRLERMPSDPEGEAAAQAQRRELKNLVARTMTAVQRISRELRPVILDELGLADAMAWRARTFEESTGIAVRLEAAPDLPPLPPNGDTALFRVFQEALTNIARHAQASQVTVRLFREKRRISLHVQDDGIGIDGQALRHPASLGLIGMRERMRAIGGDMEIESPAGAGTIVKVLLPLAKRKPKTS